MKKILFIFLALSIWSCKNDIDPPDEKDVPINFDGQHVTIDELEAFIPDVYYEKQVKVIFTNESGGEFSLNIYPGEKKTWTFNLEKGSYKSDQASFLLYNPKFPNFDITLSLVGGIYLGANKKIYKTISASLTSGLKPRMSADISFFNGKPAYGTYVAYEEIALNGKSFKNVVYGENINMTSFSALYFNEEFGIVGFRDLRNDLWVYDRIEK